MTAINDIWGLEHELDQKAPVRHTHTIRDISGLREALLWGVEPQNTGGVRIDQITGLQEALDSKAGLFLATIEFNGLMSQTDKVKLDGLSTSGGGGATTIDDVYGLRQALNNWDESINDLQAQLNQKAPIDHTHSGLPNFNPQQLSYTASQSSTYGTTPVGTYTNLTDGNLSTGTGTGNDTIAWIQADLGAIKSVSQVWIAGGAIPGGWGQSAGYLDGAALEISLDGSTWLLAIPSLAQMTDTAVAKFAFGGLAARYVRIRKSSNYIGASEFRIFG